MNSNIPKNIPHILDKDNIKKSTTREQIELKHIIDFLTKQILNS